MADEEKPAEAAEEKAEEKPKRGRPPKAKTVWVECIHPNGNVGVTDIVMGGTKLIRTYEVKDGDKVKFVGTCAEVPEDEAKTLEDMGAVKIVDGPKELPEGARAINTGW